MNMRSFVINGTACAAVVGAAAFLSIAGPLDPPGGPIAPTHKTLTEVEPRIAVNAENTPGDIDSLVKISQPGSYYLTGNIMGVAGAHGIEIAASGVTLDLMGFEVRGVLNSLDGVRVSVVAHNIRIRNGSVRDWTGSGVHAFDAFNSSLRDVVAADNGGDGLLIGDNSLVDSCAAARNGGNGIVTGDGSTILESTAAGNAASGIASNSGSTIVACTAQHNDAFGIRGEVGATISACTANHNGADGVYVNTHARVSDTTANDNGRDGFDVGSSSTVTGVTALHNGFEQIDSGGIKADVQSTVRGSTASYNDGIGIDVAQGSLVVGSIANGNGVNGIELAPDARAIDCSANGNTADGVHCFAGATVERCTVTGNLRDGVRATNDRVSIRDCKASFNVSVGINVSGDACFVTGNYSTNHPTNYSLIGTSLFGPVHTMATIGTNTNPSANFEGL